MGSQQQDGKPSPIPRKLVGLLSGKYFDTGNSSVESSVHWALTRDSYLELGNFSTVVLLK